MSDAGGGVRTLVARAVSVPVTWPAAQRRHAQAVLGLAAVMLVASVPTAAAVAALLPDAHVHLALVLLGLPVYVLVRSCVSRGQVGAAAWLMIGYFLVVPVLGSMVFGEVRASPFFPVVCVVLAGVLLPPRGVVAVGLLALAVLVGLPALVPAPADYSRTDVHVYLAIVLGLTTAAAVVGSVVADLGFRAADRSWRQARSLADELLLANSRLEEHVRRRTDELSAALDRERRLTDTLAELSIRDPLTGLYNRRQLDDELVRLVAYARRSGAPLSVAVVDLDDFKSVNDHFSHVVGDDVLRAAARVLASDTRASDVLVRMGGEEFALLMPGTDTAAAVGVCERMRVDLARFDWASLGHDLKVTASFGVAALAGTATPAELLLAADRRLLEAKRQGKNCVVETSAA